MTIDEEEGLLCFAYYQFQKDTVYTIEISRQSPESRNN